MKVLIVIPAYNEETLIQSTVERVVSFASKNLTVDWEVVVADNQSTDQTALIVQSLAAKFFQVKYLMVPVRGKGAAIRAGWNNFSADVYCFMDADLATDLAALPALIDGLASGYDLAVGSRYHPDSLVKRSLTRRVFSLGYRLALRLLVGLRVKDAPCGFKAINSKIKENLLPHVQNDQWFFDSELLILAAHQGYRIKEIPVIWQDPREGSDKSRVKPWSLALAYLKHVLELRKRLM
ncbi:MAG: glycosyltransferase family 2 protein [Candidatus Buchananbacteria bacterium]|nr:glycosyltransferase family 2 protein [Candidatus Buchananbacteria bacterium]